ncbi:TrkH family potassium uptake protein [Curtobacterium sp. C1]|uniref:TrkH family potassium uptake protein n=1 Tax=Curtobacterium TaxID=2034 RepID=UPI0007370B9F|nr:MULTISPECIES: potassium transporter TrkG [Curtobacterium]KTR19424.1 potassium transporter Trk [Curtobacterium citreum]MDK8172667.1 potassium transporter TrkG [Curtobacterium citreum]QKS15940.1 TrkH family potassium uptake protein [Curtobacterium sp. Csp2]UFU13162.1 TrkH family potassium uptake protein [Curtobacterium sp. C1]
MLDRTEPLPPQVSASRRQVSRIAAVLRSSPSRLAILVFIALVFLFTLLFMTPMASADGTTTHFSDALFTAASVVCVTGLATVDMATHWSVFGKTLVVIGTQIGAVGVLTFASILGLVVTRRLGLRAKLIAAGDSNPLRTHHGAVPEGQAVRLGEVGTLLLTVAVSTLTIEIAVGLLLLPSVLVAGYPFWTAVGDSFYYAAMAFTNTGFAPNADGLAPFTHDYWFLSLLMVAVVLGSIGFPVIRTLTKQLRSPRRWPIHVKLTLTTSAVLLLLGAVVYIALEASNPRTLGSEGAGHTAFQALFFSTMTRSGGFATIDVEQMHGASLLVTDMLMFIGGGSASTAGGIKVTTLAVLFLAAVAEARGRRSMEAFGRRIPSDVLRVAVAVVLWGATIVAVATVVLLQITGDSLDRVLFEVISAFATCGLSSGISAELPESGKYVLAATMFLGRVGTVTIAAALAASQSRQLFRRPEERPIVG